MENSVAIRDICPVLPENDTLWTDARQLHTALQSKQVFSMWFKSRIKKYDLKEGKDYKKSKDSNLVNSLSTTKQLKQRKNYWITVNTAKHIAMLENTQIGVKARDYFLECEKMAKIMNVHPIPSMVDDKENKTTSPYEILKCTWTLYKEIGLTGRDFAIAADRAHEKVLGYSALNVAQIKLNNPSK